MPSIFTQSLRQELQASGENDSTWGDKLNQNFREVLEQAIAGVATINMGDADYTLSVAYGAADEARNSILIISGSLMQARNIIVPAVPKNYTVQNITSGGHAIVIKTANGQGVTVTNGEVGIMFCNGSNMVSAAAATADGSLIPSKITAGAAQWRMNGSFGVNLSVPVSSTVGRIGVDGSAGSQYMFYMNGALVATHTVDANALSTNSSRIMRWGINGTTYMQMNMDGTVAFGTSIAAAGVSSTTSIAANTSLTCGTTLGVGTNATIGGTLGVAGTATFNNNASVGGTLNITGNTTAAAISCTTLTASSNITLSSDERLKYKWQSLPSNIVERLAQVKAGTYALKANGPRGTRFVGVGAQSLQEAWPEAVDTSDPTHLKVNMSFLSAAVVALSKKLVELERRLAEMESE